MQPSQAEEIVRDLYEDRRDRLGYDEIRHVEAVVENVREHTIASTAFGIDCEVIAWLHDTVEDGLLSFREVYPDLTKVQFEALLLITRDGRLTYMNYIRMLKNAPGEAGHIARCVKRADLRHNMTRPCPESMRGMREPGGRYDRATRILDNGV